MAQYETHRHSPGDSFSLNCCKPHNDCYLNDTLQQFFAKWREKSSMFTSADFAVMVVINTKWELVLFITGSCDNFNFLSFLITHTHISHFQITADSHTGIIISSIYFAIIRCASKKGMYKSKTSLWEIFGRKTFSDFQFFTSKSSQGLNDRKKDFQ